MNDMAENRQVIDRAWPAPKSLTREAMADELVRDNLYRKWDWFRAEPPENKSDMLSEVINILFRDTSLKSDSERATEARAYIAGFCEAWAENEAEECDE